MNPADIPQVLAILPLRNSVFFPGGVLPLAVGRQKTIALIKDAVRDDQVIGVVTQQRAEEENPGASDLYGMGTVARIVKLLKMGEENYSLVVQGHTRFRVVELVQESPYLKARIEAVDDHSSAESIEGYALQMNLKKVAREVIELMPELPTAATELVESIDHPGHLADLIAANVDVPIEEKQAVLDTVDLKSRMKLVLELLARKGEVLKVTNEIDAKVRAALEEETLKRARQLPVPMNAAQEAEAKAELSIFQRQFYMRQLLKAIDEVLGGEAAGLGTAVRSLRALRDHLQAVAPSAELGDLDAGIADLSAVCEPRGIPGEDRGVNPLEIARRIEPARGAQASKIMREYYLRQEQETLLSELHGASSSRPFAQRFADAVQALRRARDKLSPTLAVGLLDEMDAILSDLASVGPGRWDAAR